MTGRAQIFSILVGMALFLVIMSLVRRKRLQEEASLLWLAAGVLMVLIPVWKEGFFWLSGALGIQNAASAIFMLGFVFVLFVLLHLSVIASRLTEQNREFAQVISLLREELERAGSLPVPGARAAGAKDEEKR
jgi:hypothetical protein